MTKVVASGVFLVLMVQVFAFTQLERELVVAAAGVALACVLIAIRGRLTHRGELTDDATENQTEVSLRRWLARTETLIAWSESTRADWDRRLRPMLARQFELAAGHRRSKDPKVFQATGHMLFGAELWQWVDPENISRTGGTEPGPGRATLRDILERLEKL